MAMMAQNAASLLNDICGKRIMVIGDVMLDRFVDGAVKRISPEAPVPVLSDMKTTSMPGGAANVARNLSQLGVSCHLFGVVGKDASADELAAQLQDIPELSLSLLESTNRPTTTKTRFRSGAQQILRIDDEITTPLSEEDSQKLQIMIAQALPNCDLIILSDYAKGCLSHDVIAQVIKAAKLHDIPTIIDPKSDDFSKYQGGFLVTPNLSELVGATGLEALDDTAIQQAAKSLANHHDISYILTTLSARGMRLDGTETSLAIGSIAKDVFDVSGAGDTVVASLAAAYSAGASLEEAMIFANQAASIVVSKPGTAAYCAGEMLASCMNEAELDISTTSCLALVKSWRDAGLRIGFTNGCFDLLHPGHLHVLRQAKAHCDKLIIGLNSDASVAALKGPSRPLQSQQVRAQNLNQFDFCDAVVVFDDDTPAALIDAIIPDILMKGGDYIAEEIVGFDTVTKNGGDVLTIPLLEGHSTTAILKRS